MIMMDWLDCAISERDIVAKQVSVGLMKPTEAETWAKSQNQPFIYFESRFGIIRSDE